MCTSLFMSIHCGLCPAKVSLFRRFGESGWLISLLFQASCFAFLRAQKKYVPKLYNIVSRRFAQVSAVLRLPASQLVSCSAPFPFSSPWFALALSVPLASWVDSTRDSFFFSLWGSSLFLEQVRWFLGALFSRFAISPLLFSPLSYPCPVVSLLPAAAEEKTI